ncbi:MAG: helicase-associated domain-containing protein, partial [Tumebacillaceae bacterium]
RMLQEGWLYRMNTKGGRQFYFIPDDLRRTLRDYLSHNLKQRVQVAEQEPIIYRDENFALVRDAVVFLQHVEKHDVRITKDGTILKRKQQEIFLLLEIKEEVLGNVSWRFGYGRRFHDYPDRFALLYDYCFNRELIVETADGQLLIGDKCRSWLALSDKERAEDLFRFWRLLYRRPIPKLKLCIATLAQAAKENWIYAESMNELLAPYVKDYYYDKVQTVLEQRIYNMLVHLGLLAHGQLANGAIVIKVTSLGRELLLQEETAVEEVSESVVQHPPLILQPNFDLLVPIESFEPIAGELEEVTDLIRVDTMRVHRITKSSVRRAFENGWTGETVLDFLRQETGDMVPGNVERMIEQWAAEYGRVKLFRAVVVECGDAAMANDLKTLADVAPHVRLELTATHFLIAEQGVSPLQQALAKMGYQADIVG